MQTYSLDNKLIANSKHDSWICMSKRLNKFYSKTSDKNTVLVRYTVSVCKVHSLIESAVHRYWWWNAGNCKQQCSIR